MSEAVQHKRFDFGNGGVGEQISMRLFDNDCIGWLIYQPISMLQRWGYDELNAASFLNSSSNGEEDQSLMQP